MKILIAYATTDRQTLKISEFMAEQIRQAGHEAEMFDTNSRRDDVDLDQYDKIIVAGSVHQLKHQKCLEIFVFAKRGEARRIAVHVRFGQPCIGIPGRALPGRRIL